MKVQAIFVLPKGATTPELATAWDEYSIDSWPEGFEEDVERAVKHYKGEIESHAVVTLHFSESQVMEILKRKATLWARVEEAQ